MKLPQDSAARPAERGYAMAALLVGLSVMAVLMSMALPVWSQMAKREREAELIFRGQQYARAIGLFQRKFANTFPPNVDVLVEQRFLRKKYKDPVTGEDFQIIPAGGAAGMPGGVGGSPFPGGVPGGTTPATLERAGGITRTGPPAGGGLQPIGGPSVAGMGIQGVVSKSKDTSIKIYNGRTKYNEWAFVYLATARAVGAPQPGEQPMMPGGRPNAPGGPGAGRPPIPNQPGFGPFAPGGRPGMPAPPGQPPGGFGRPGMPPMQPGQPNPFAPPTPFTPPQPRPQRPPG